MGEKKYNKRGPGGTGRPGGRSGGAGSGPTKGGGGGGRGKGTRHTGSASSSSVHDGIRILVVSMATAVLGVIGGIGVFMAHGYGVF